MSVHEHVEVVKKQTGKSPEDFSLLAKAEYLATHNEIVDWLKTKFELSHGHATTISHLILQSPSEKAADNKAMASQFSGVKADWMPACRELFSKVERFGHDVTVDLQSEPIAFKRGTINFGLVMVDKSKLEIGLNLPGTPFNDTYTEATDWTDRITHKASFIVQQQINDELISWLRQAYDKAI